MKKAVIVGSRGQDGQILAPLLESRGYKVLGIHHRGPVDVRKARAVAALIERFKPDEIYYLAAHHHSAEQDAAADPALFQKSWDVHVAGLVNFLEAIREKRPKARLFYAASSRVFGDCGGGRVDEKTAFAPNDAYGLTKALGVEACRFYRRRHRLFASTGILFNHESPLRSPAFVSKKIARAAAKGRKLVLGRLDDQRDWSWAADIVEAMAAVLRARRPDDFVMASGRAHSVREFAQKAYAAAGRDWRDYVREDPRLLPTKRPALIGNPAKLRRATGWKPRTSFADMVAALVEAEHPR